MKERRETCRASERARDLARENARETMFEVEGGGGGVVQVGAPLLVPLNRQTNAGDDNEDRKRLKEKLKASSASLTQSPILTLAHFKFSKIMILSFVTPHSDSVHDISVSM